MRERISRNRFLKVVTGLVLFPVLYIFGKATRLETGNTGSKQVTVTGPFPEGITFYDDFIVIKSGNGLRVLSNRCTHLGCHINRQQNGNVQCPCHGSRFDSEGRAVKGPAYKPLQTLQYELRNDSITVFVT